MSETNYNTGWIALHRQFMEHRFYQERRVFSKMEAWLDILLNVNHSEQKVLIGNQTLTCGRGQSLYSLDTWAERWRWHKSSVRRFLKLLQEDNMVVTENVSKTTRLTVCKYGQYQNIRHEFDTDLTRIRHGLDTDLTPNNNDNNDNNDNKSVETAPQKDSGKKKKQAFVPPTFEQVKEAFIQKTGLNGALSESFANKFLGHYESNGWKVGKNKMSDWKAALTRTWLTQEHWIETISRYRNQSTPPTNKTHRQLFDE